MLALPIAVSVGVVGFALVPQANAATQASSSPTSQVAEKSGESSSGASDASVQAVPVKLTSDQAKKIAEASANGTATSVQKEDENGTIVYMVSVAGKELAVDANSGKVVSTPAGGNTNVEQGGGNSQGADTPEANDTPDTGGQAK